MLCRAGCLALAAVSVDAQMCADTPVSSKAAKGSPNIVLFLTDDMDKQLGGWDPMSKASRRLSEQGATANNWMIHTPVCCPSRSELVTGRYFHNIRMDTPTGGCMHVNVTASLDHPFYKEWHFAQYLQQAGYTVGMFGKQLNQGNPSCPPRGVDRWFANGGGDYFSPSFTWASAGTPSSSVHFNNCTYNGGSCYSTSVIGNVSLAWMRDVLAQPEDTRKPFFAYVAVKAPHIQDGPGWPVPFPAPWYDTEDRMQGLAAPRTPNWNASCQDHHWLVRQQPPMTAEEAQRSDALYRKRHLALLSVDDLVEEVVGELETLGAADNTYFLFTSDHGYQFGQFRMPQGKWNVYDNNLRIPMVIRGPGIPKGSSFDYIATNVDVMPTILGLAGVETPPTMDGQSLAKLLVTDLEAAPAPTQQLLVQEDVQAAEWRTMQLIEYNGLGNVVRYQHLEDSPNNTFRALRVVDGKRNLKLVEFVDISKWDFNDGIDEYELFDLDADPWEMQNLWPTADSKLAESLQAELERLFRCQGTSCHPMTSKSVAV